MTSIELDDGKYTVVHDSGAGLHALRYGEHWRDMTGDGLVLAMAQEIEDLRRRIVPVQQVSVPQCVLDWFEAKQAHVTAVDAYNARLAFVREHMPFGTSVDPEYQIMEAADRKARSLVGPMFSGLRDLAAAPAAPAADAGVNDHD